MKFIIKGSNPHLECKVVMKNTALGEHTCILSVSSQTRFISCNLGVWQWPQKMVKLEFVAELTAQLYVHLKAADSEECCWQRQCSGLVVRILSYVYHFLVNATW